jgi:hypothetical protein
MAVVRRTQIVNAPVERVFGAVIDGAEYARWNPTIGSSRRLDSGELGNGATFEWDLRGFGKVIQELQEFDRDKQVRIVPHTTRLEGGHRFRFTAQDGSTRIDHELEMNPKGVFRVFSPVMGVVGSRNLRDTADALAVYVEHST